MELKLGTGGKAVSTILVVLGTLILAALAYVLDNPYWYYPLMALFMLLSIGRFPNQDHEDKFEWLYCALLVVALGVLFHRPAEIYWIVPIIGGFSFRFVVGQLKINVG